MGEGKISTSAGVLQPLEKAGIGLMVEIQATVHFLGTNLLDIYIVYFTMPVLKLFKKNKLCGYTQISQGRQKLA